MSCRRIHAHIFFFSQIDKVEQYWLIARQPLASLLCSLCTEDWPRTSPCWEINISVVSITRAWNSLLPGRIVTFRVWILMKGVEYLYSLCPRISSGRRCWPGQKFLEKGNMGGHVEEGSGNETRGLCTIHYLGKVKVVGQDCSEGSSALSRR